MNDGDRGADDETSSGDFFAMSLDHICVAGFDGYFKRVNPSWTTTLGWSAEELLARPVTDFMHPDDRVVTLEGRDRLSRPLIEVSDTKSVGVGTWLALSMCHNVVTALGGEIIVASSPGRGGDFPGACSGEPLGPLKARVGIRSAA